MVARRRGAEQEGFVLSRKLYDVEAGNLGVVTIHVDVAILDNIYRHLDLPESSNMYLIDDQGKILYSDRKEIINTAFNKDDVFNGLFNKDSGSYYSDDQVYYYDTFFISNWKLVVEMPESFVTQESRQIVLLALVFIFISLAGIILVSNYGTKYLVKPIKSLVTKMEDGAKGDLSVRFKGAYHDEIGDLGRSFNAMMKDINHLITELEEEQQKKIEAEIHLLEAHINPHFLYNTLASMYWTALAEGNEKIAFIANALSNYFRLGLNKGKEFTSVVNEVTHVKEYLAIQKVRFEDKLTYEMDIQKGIENLTITKFILQPLAENAIVHGFKDMDQIGHIDIRVYREGSSLYFVVTDNGCGLQDLKRKSVDQIIRSGYGLHNINRRLELYYKKSFTFNMENLDQGLKVTITIPVEMEQ